MFNLSLSIVIPIYNEQENIGKLIDKINSLLIKKIKKFQIIVVDDNSSDNSKLIIKKKIKKFKNIKYFLRKKNRDLSKSVIKGFEMSKYNNIIVMDGDLQHNPIYILKFVDILISKNSDFIIGSRNFKNYNFKKSLSYTRYLFSKIVILLNNLCLKLKLKDPMSDKMILALNSFIKNASENGYEGPKELGNFIKESIDLGSLEEGFISHLAELI